MKKIIFIPLNSNLFLFKIFVFLKIIQYCLFERCNKNNPFLFHENCVPSCKKEDIDSKLCILENEIITTQYLNNIIYINQINLTYNDIVVSDKNDLYYLMSMYPKTNLRLIYLLNNEGYGLLDRENSLYNTSIDDPEAKGRYESITFLMTLSSDTNNNQYLISISKSYRLMEIYDLKSNQIYFNKAEDIFNVLKLFILLLELI